jgi:CRISPR-associated protein Csm5
MKHVNFNLELKVITPVHIGAGEKYTKLDFVFDPGKQQAGLLHEQRWLRWLSEKGRLEQYTQEMQRQGMHLDNFRWLDQQNYRNPLEQCKDIFVNIFDVDDRTSAMIDIVRQVKDVHQCPYIPGSSFKGVLRTGNHDHI